MTNKSKNKNLGKARNSKNNEFYTQLTDIEKELGHYKKYFKGKTVFCNCDDPQESDFWKYFSLNFEFLGLKKLISTHFEKAQPSYKLEIVRDINDDGKINNLDTIKTPLKQNGDFRSPECIEILKEADIVVTNPPFSLFREYVAQLVEYDKNFIIIGNQNAITYKEIFKLIKENKIWLGHTSPKKFLQPDGSIKTFGNISWYTNLETQKRHEDLILYKKYYGFEDEYPKYDNYDAINLDKVKNIPMDYDGAMGVPITFLCKYNPEQFEIMSSNNIRVNDKLPFKEHGLIKDKDGTINGKATYVRIVIKNRKVSK